MLQNIIRRLKNLQASNKEQNAWNREWLQIEKIMQQGTLEDIVLLKASKIRTYAKLKYRKGFRVGMTKIEMAEEIIALRKEG